MTRSVSPCRAREVRSREHGPAQTVALAAGQPCSSIFTARQSEAPPPGGLAPRPGPTQPRSLNPKPRPRAPDSVLLLESADESPLKLVASAPPTLALGPRIAVAVASLADVAVPCVSAFANIELAEMPSPVLDVARPLLLADLTPSAFESPEDIDGPAAVSELDLTLVLDDPAVNARLLLIVCCAPTALYDMPSTDDCAESLPRAVAADVTRPEPIMPRTMPFASEVAFLPDSASELASAVPERNGLREIAPDMVAE